MGTIPTRPSANDLARARAEAKKATADPANVVTAEHAASEPPEKQLFTMPQAELPDPPGTNGQQPKPPKSAITLSTTVQHRGRTITISATDMRLDAFCDYLDRAGYDAPAPAQWHTLPDGTPICPKHATPMRKREKQGDEWWSHRVFGPDGQELWCKGYHGKDSPGYEY